MNTKLLSALSCTIIICYSCQDDSILEALHDKGIDVESAALSRSITEDEVYQFQTDKLAMLINSIEKIDSEYILTLSPEDAYTLGISDSLYHVAESILMDYNNLQIQEQ